MSGDDDEPEDQDQHEPLPSGEPTVDAGSPRAVRKRLNKLQILAIEEERFWQGVFADPVGRRCMWKLLSEGHPFETKFACGPNGSPQAEATWFHAGEQHLTLRMYQTWFSKFPAEVMQMTVENDPRFKAKDK